MKTNLTILATTLALAAPAFAQTSDEELVKQLANPVASLISVPFQSNFDFRMGPLDQGTQFKLNFQPVIPISMNQNWNLIVRTIVPYISQENVFKGPLPQFPGPPGRVPDALDRAAEKAFNKAVKKRFPNDKHQDGLSDIVQSFFSLPKEPVGGWILGFGPVLLYPSATDDKLGTEKWAAGPTALALKQNGGWTYGVLANHLWSYAGNEDRRSVNVPSVAEITRPTHEAGTDAADKLAKKFGIKTAWGTDLLYRAKNAAAQSGQFSKMVRWSSPTEVLRQATAQHAELLAHSGPRNPSPGKLGTVEESALADLLLVDGDRENWHLPADEGRYNVASRLDETQPVP